MKYTIDAQGKKLGRVASEAAGYLMGKTSTSFSRSTPADVHVTIINANKAAIDAKKKLDKEYTTFTGFRGGIYGEKLGDLMERKGAGEAFRRAIYRMIPSNSLRKKAMKNLIITE